MIDERDRWPQGLVRHLILDPDCPPDTAYAIRVDHDGGLSFPGGSTDIHYTLVLHPSRAELVVRIRAELEANPAIGGPFSPPRDIPNDDRPS